MFCKVRIPKLKLETFQSRLSVVLVMLAVPGTILVASHLLYSAYCAFTWGNFTMFDYGVYSNTIWNTGHWNGFKVLVDDDYLSTHLSFTLGLLGPIYYLWNHPFALAVAQWLMVIGGACLIWRAARRHHIQADLIAALVFFFVAYRLTQGVLLSEFHGVSTYFLTVPWLYYCCAFDKKRAWLPLTLILGLREDAFLFILPMLLYFAIKDRWKTGYVLVGVSILYGLLALLVIYPAINGITIFHRRASVLKIKAHLELINSSGLTPRGYSVLWTLLPILALAHWRSLAALVFPSAALIKCLLSGFPTQQALGSHYGANVMVCLAVGLVEAAAARRRAGSSVTSGRRLDTTLRAVALVVVTVVFHLHSGFLLGGGKNSDMYRNRALSGEVAMQTARQIPRDGTLLADDRLSAYCSNRENILTFRRHKKHPLPFDSVFTTVSGLEAKLDGRLWELLMDGTFGVRAFDGRHVVLVRGHGAAGNRQFAESLRYGPIIIPLTPKHGGRDLDSRGSCFTRYWEGEGHRTPINLSYGGYRRLDAGRYFALFRYRAEYPRKIRKNTWGWFSVHLLNEPDDIARADIQQVETPVGVFISQLVPFELQTNTYVEVRVTGGDAQLWLDSAMFVPRDK